MTDKTWEKMTKFIIWALIVILTIILLSGCITIYKTPPPCNCPKADKVEPVPMPIPLQIDTAFLRPGNWIPQMLPKYYVQGDSVGKKIYL